MIPMFLTKQAYRAFAYNGSDEYENERQNLTSHIQHNKITPADRYEKNVPLPSIMRDYNKLADNFLEYICQKKCITECFELARLCGVMENAGCIWMPSYRIPK